MILNVLGSNSFGNGYVLQNDNEALLIECGVHPDQMFKTIQYKLPKVQCAIVTHEHDDHAEYVREYADYGINVLALPSVIESHNLKGNSHAIQIQTGKAYKAGNFIVQAFDVKHDVPCVGWLIKHPDIGKMIFVTDTYAMPYVVEGLNNIMIEANYADDILDKRIEQGIVPEVMRYRLYRSHMEFGTTKDILQKLPLSEVENIILIHLSDGNSDSRRFVDEIVRQTGKRVWAAQKGLTINLTY